VEYLERGAHGEKKEETQEGQVRVMIFSTILVIETV